jgi:hypothetical protein
MNINHISSTAKVEIPGENNIHHVPQTRRINQETLIEPGEELPTYRQPDTLPQLLKEGVDKFRIEEEKNLFLLSTLTVCSGLFTNMYGTYRQSKNYPNLFLLVEAPPASGKSAMLYSRKLIKKIHDKVMHASVKEKEEYERKVKALRKSDSDLPPPRPPFKVVLIPANSSGSKFISHLADNQYGDIPSILIESEIDTLTNAIGNEWGNFSDVLRCAFQNETVGMSRRKDNEYIEIHSPKLAVALSGTMNQVKKLINNSEDGLFSRFLVYSLDTGIQWSDVSPCQDCINLTDFFDMQADEYRQCYEYISKKPYEVKLTDEQWKTLNEDFGNELSYVAAFGDPNLSGVIKRHGLMVFKVCMTLTGFRIYEGKIESDVVECKQEDFETAMYLVKKSLGASKEMFQQLPGGGSKQSNGKGSPLYRQLPDEFTYTDAIGLTESLGVADRTIERHLKQLVKEGLLIQPERGKYKKLSD